MTPPDRTVPLPPPGEPAPVRPGEELKAAPLLAYLRDTIPALPDAPLEVRQFPAGASNLTYLLRIGAWEAVLRRPPFGPVPPKAHDVVREARLLERLHPVYPLAPEPYAACEDPAVIGAPFFVMERRHGVVLDARMPPGMDAAEHGARISEAFVETLAALHAVDWRAAGFEGFGRPEGFLARQAEGWIGRWERAVTEEVPEAAPLARWLVDHVPESPAPTLIHNDFKLNNLLLDPADPARVKAVLDWEMATVGDPLFDLAVALGYWAEPDDPPALRDLVPTVTSTPGFHTRDALVRRYAGRTGRDVAALGWYLVFARFKLAVIVQQIHARWARGQTRDPRFATLGEVAARLVRHAHADAASAR